MPPDTLGTPDILLMVSEEVLVFDNLAGTIQLIVNADPAQESALERAQLRLAELVARLPQPMAPLPDVVLDAAESAELEQQAESDFTREMYEASVDKVKEYVLAGDVMQVVPSQRMSIPFINISLPQLCIGDYSQSHNQQKMLHNSHTSRRLANH